MKKLNLDHMKMLDVGSDRRWSRVLVEDNDGEMPNFYCIMPNGLNLIKQKKYDDTSDSTPLCEIQFQTHTSRVTNKEVWVNDGVTDENLISILRHRLQSLKQFKTPDKDLEWRIDKALMLIKELHFVNQGIFYENIMTRDAYENNYYKKLLKN